MSSAAPSSSGHSSRLERVAREQLEQQRAALGARAGGAGRVGGDEPQLAAARLEPEELAELGAEQRAGAAVAAE